MPSRRETFATLNLEERQRARRQALLGWIIIVTTVTGMLGLFLFAILRSPLEGSSSSQQAHKNGSFECYKRPDHPADRRKNKGLLKLANFNVEWLFQFGGHGKIKCPGEACPWGDESEAKRHIKDVAEILNRLDADIVHLTEVEDCRVLRALLEELPKGHGYLPYLIFGNDHATGQNIAVLSRVDPSADIRRTNDRVSYPVKESRCTDGKHKGSTGVSKNYLARFDVANGKGATVPLVVTGLHFLARPQDKRRCMQREAQAVVLRDNIRSMSKSGERVVILGDYNDFDPSAIGVDGREPISATLPILYGSAGDGHELINAASLLPQQERYTCWFDYNQNCVSDGDREHVMIDHILLSKSLKIVDTKTHHTYNVSCAEHVSDHWPFSVTIEL